MWKVIYPLAILSLLMVAALWAAFEGSNSLVNVKVFGVDARLGGAIGAYFVLFAFFYWVYERINLHVISPNGKILRSINGKWNFVSHHKNSAGKDEIWTGECVISRAPEGLSILGDFRKDGKIIGHWISQYVVVRNKELAYLFKVDGDAGSPDVLGLTRLNFTGPRFREMFGTWGVLGQIGSGRIEFRKGVLREVTTNTQPRLPEFPPSVLAG